MLQLIKGNPFKTSLEVPDYIMIERGWSFMRNKIFRFTTVIALVMIGNLYATLATGNSVISAHAENITENILNVENKVSSQSEMEDIAVNLFTSYIKENSTDWKKVQYEKLNRTPLKTIEDYKIINASLVSVKEDNFCVKIIYDVKCTEESDMWLAGNGFKDTDNWIRNKSNYVSVKNEENKCFIIGTDT